VLWHSACVVTYLSRHGTIVIADFAILIFYFAKLRFLDPESWQHFSFGIVHEFSFRSNCLLYISIFNNLHKMYYRHCASITSSKHSIFMSFHVGQINQWDMLTCYLNDERKTISTGWEYQKEGKEYIESITRIWRLRCALTNPIVNLPTTINMIQWST